MNLSNKFFKYALVAIILIVLFRTLFKNNTATSQESIVIALVITLGFIVVDNICNSSNDEGFASISGSYVLPDSKAPFTSFGHFNRNRIGQRGGEDPTFATFDLPDVATVVTKAETTVEPAKVVTAIPVPVATPTPTVVSPPVTVPAVTVPASSAVSPVAITITQPNIVATPVATPVITEVKPQVVTADGVVKLSTETQSTTSGVRLASANAQERDKCRWQDDVIVSDMKYTDYNHLPMADGVDDRSYEYGYSFMPPERWAGAHSLGAYPPICVTNKRNDIFPVLSSGNLTADLKEWNDTLRVTNPDNINVKYIREKLNSGR